VVEEKEDCGEEEGEGEGKCVGGGEEYVRTLWLDNNSKIGL
jgi:hypothetical protein